MSVSLVFGPGVQEEIQEAYFWYELQTGGVGDEFRAAVKETLDRIQADPDSYAVVLQDVRRLTTQRFPYAVYYRILGEEVVVIAVVHTSRSPRVWQRRL